MQSVFFDYQSNAVHSLKFGDGDQLLIVFPGYGDYATTFLKLQSSLEKKYTVYVIDLPLHGETKWSQEQFSLDFFSTVIQLILEKENKERFALMGHSFGGRIVLKLVPQFNKELTYIYLLASDGLKTSEFSPIKNMPVFLRKLVKKTMKSPDKVLSLAKGLNRIKLLPNHSLAFFQLQLRNPRRIERLFLFWLSIPSFQINIAQVKRMIKEKQIPIAMFMGLQDEIIPAKLGKRFSENLPSVTLYLLDDGHLLIGEELNKIIQSIKTK